MNFTNVNTGAFAGWGWKPPRRARVRAAIVAALLRNRDVLALSTPRLVADIVMTFGVGFCTAYSAVYAARSQITMCAVLHVELGAQGRAIA